MSKKVIIINCFPTIAHSRTEPIKYFLLQKGVKVKMITSDFDHFKKKQVLLDDPCTIQIHVPHYKKNISIKRLYSHYIFCKKTLKTISNEHPDVIYAKIPPNILVNMLGKYRRKNNVKLIYDIYDLWPESFPGHYFILKPFFLIWKSFRDCLLKENDCLISECSLYNEVLKLENSNVLYLSQKDYSNFVLKDIDITTINICYLGNISHLLDISLCKRFLLSLSKKMPICVHIIGDGERKSEFLNSLKECKIEYKYYGTIFDEEKKLDIMKKCCFGLNLMKETSIVGLSNKSIEYFKSGLSVINNIKYDTYDLIERNNSGFNIHKNNIEIITSKISEMAMGEFNQMKRNSRNVYINNFSEKVFYSKLNKILNKCLN